MQNGHACSDVLQKISEQEKKIKPKILLENMMCLSYRCIQVIGIIQNKGWLRQLLNLHSTGLQIVGKWFFTRLVLFGRLSSPH